MTYPERIALDSKGNVVTVGETPIQPPPSSEPPGFPAEQRIVVEYTGDGARLWSNTSGLRDAYTCFAFSLFTTAANDVVAVDEGLRHSDVGKNAVTTTEFSPDGQVIALNVLRGVRKDVGFVEGYAAAYDPELNQYYLITSAVKAAEACATILSPTSPCISDRSFQQTRSARPGLIPAGH